MKIKSAALILMLGNCIWVIEQLYYTYQRIWGNSSSYYKDKPLESAISTLVILVPVAFIIFSYAVYSKKVKATPPALADDTANVNMLDVDIANISVGSWIGTFFLTLIPLVGIILLIVWAMDDKKPIRKNWAIASLIWALVQIVIVVIVYSALLGSARLY